jgi:hypothetical protein
MVFEVRYKGEDIFDRTVNDGMDINLYLFGNRC